MRLSTTISSLEVPAAFSPVRSRLSYPQSRTNRRGKMRLTLIVAVALALTPAAALIAHATGLQAQATDVSAAKKNPKKAKAPKEEYLKAAPGTGPSGPRK